MPKYQVERSIVIDAPKEKILESLKNYEEWRVWSPWLIMEKDAEVTYSDNQGELHSTNAWSGTLLGSGNMELTGIDINRLEMKLQLLQPFKSKSDVFFDVEEQGKSSKVTWTMKSSVPFFLFFMVKQIKAFVAMDYERGLRMFKEYMEKGEVSSSLSIDGIVPLEAKKYVGIRHTSSFEELGEVMKKDFDTLYAFIQEHNIELKTPPFSIYNTFDMTKKESEFICCIPYSGNAPLPEGFEKGLFETREALRVTHVGKYEHLGNAWSTAFTYVRTKKMKTTTAPVGMEFYLNSPYEVEAKALVTEVYLPLHKKAKV